MGGDVLVVNPYTATAEDALMKQIKTRNAIKRAQGKTHLRLQGCPVSVAEQVQTLVAMGGLHDPSMNWQGMKAYFVWKSKMLVKKVGGHRYQIHGPTQRGEAAPNLERPAAAAE